MTCDPVHLCGISLNFGHVIMTCDPTYNQSQKLKKKKKNQEHRDTEQRKTENRRNSGTPRNTSGTSRNNETIKNDEQL